MYVQYCLIAIATIFVLSFIVYYIMKKNNQANRKNTVNLALCTFLTIISASLTPLLAKLFVKELSFSIYGSVIVAIILFIGLVLAVFYILQPSVTKWAKKVSDENDVKKSESIIEKILGALIQGSENATEESPLSADTVTVSVEEISTTQEADVVNEPIMAELTSVTYEAIESREITAENEKIITKENETIKIIEKPSDQQTDILELLDIAIEHKNNRDYYGAIAFYETALVLNPDDELCFLIILDLCSLYKMTNQSESAYKLLESNTCKLLDSNIKADILRNIIIN